MFIWIKAEEARAVGKTNADTEWIDGYGPAKETLLYQQLYDDIKTVHPEPAYEDYCSIAAYVRYARITAGR